MIEFEDELIAEWHSARKCNEYLSVYALFQWI